jgi:hypothetical protein
MPLNESFLSEWNRYHSDNIVPFLSSTPSLETHRQFEEQLQTRPFVTAVSIVMAQDFCDKFENESILTLPDIHEQYSALDDLTAWWYSYVARIANMVKTSPYKNDHGFRMGLGDMRQRYMNDEFVVKIEAEALKSDAQTDCEEGSGYLEAQRVVSTFKMAEKLGASNLPVLDEMTYGNVNFRRGVRELLNSDFPAIFHPNPIDARIAVDSFRAGLSRFMFLDEYFK